MAQQKVTWTGDDGTRYEYNVHALDTDWYDVPGNYIFTKKNTAGLWVAIYIGETGSLRDRLSGDHEKYPCGRLQGMTHIHAHVSSEARATRLAEEQNLVRRYNPPCND